MTDPNGTETTAEYYIVRISRRHPGTDGEPTSIIGVVEDTEGRQQPFRDKEALWAALAASLDSRHT